MRREHKRTVINRQALTALRLGFVEGMAELGRRVIATAEPHVPDEEPIGKGLVRSGDWGVWTKGKKVAGTASKPSTVKLPAGGVTLIAGYGFPARFNEIGTVHQPSRPFLTPALLEVVPTASDAIKAPVRRALQTVRS